MRLPALLAVALLGAAANPDDSFRAWVNQSAGAGRVLCVWGTADLDGDGEADERVAVFDVSGERVAVVESGSARVAFQGGASLQCGRPPAWGRLAQKGRPVDRLDAWSGENGVLEIALRGGKPVVVSESMTSIMGGYSEDWDALRGTRNVRTDDAEVEAEYGLVPVLRERSGARVPTWVVFGEKDHQGAADASLAVEASPAGEHAVRLRITVTDDVAVPLPHKPKARDWVASDHVEIWTCPGALSHHDCKKPRQLAIAADTAGKLAARWLHPAGVTDPLPAVSGGRTSIELELTMPRGPVAQDGSVWIPLTVAYSDADAPGAGQQTLLATSKLQWGNALTFGILRRFPEDTRYQPWPARAPWPNARPAERSPR